MKKCPWCAEKIQDEAIVCRYCGKELQKINQEKASNELSKKNNSLVYDETIAPEKVVSEVPPIIPQKDNNKFIIKWHQRIIWRAIILGILYGFFVLFYMWFYRSPEFLYLGICLGLTGILVFFLAYVIIANLWRRIFKKTLETNEKKRELILFFEVFFVIICYFLISLLLMEINKLALGSYSLTSPELTTNLSVIKL